MARPAPLLAAALAALVLVACGDSEDEMTAPTAPPADQGGAPNGRQGPIGTQVRICETQRAGFRDVRVTAVSCPQARRVMLAWEPARPCVPPRGGSRASCSVLGYQCLSVAAGASGRTLSVSCAQAGRSISFAYVRR